MTEIFEFGKIFGPELSGAAEQVKQVKQLLHRNLEVLLQRNF